MDAACVMRRGFVHSLDCYSKHMAKDVPCGRVRQPDQSWTPDAWCVLILEGVNKSVSGRDEDVAQMANRESRSCTSDIDRRSPSRARCEVTNEADAA